MPLYAYQGKTNISVEGRYSVELQRVRGGGGIPPVRKREGVHTSTKKRGDEGKAVLVQRGGEVGVRDCKGEGYLSEVSATHRATTMRVGEDDLGNGLKKARLLSGCYGR